MSCSHQKLCYQLKNKSSDNTVHFLQYFDGRDLLDDSFIYDYIARRENFVGLSYNRIKELYRWFLVPCGQCTECRLNKAREMANRIYLEMLTTDNVWAVTLTYDEANLPYGNEVIGQYGELMQYPTLKSDDVTAFNKALRQYFDLERGHQGIMFYVAGEYGPDHGRPHYHFIYFNLPLLAKDMRLCKEKTQTGEDMFESDILTNIWHRGRVRINAVSWRYACYCARYIMKKQLGKGAEKYKILGIEPEFTRCSKRPGIGKKYFELHKDELLRTGEILIRQGEKSVHVGLPQYFFRLAEQEGLDISKLKEKRRDQGEQTLNKVLFEISQDYFDYQRSLEQEKISRSKSLPRIDL